MVVGSTLCRGAADVNVFDELNLSRADRCPAIVAAEASECGLACLAMIAGYHGRDIDLNALRQRFTVSLSGTTLRDLMAQADQLGLGGRALKVELEALRQVRTPAILHWDLNHYVVLTRIGPKGATINDPARGARTLSLAELSKHFSGVVLELTPTAEFSRAPERTPVRLDSLWTRSTGFWGAAAQILGLSLALQIATFALPFQIQLVVDEAIARADGDLLNVLALGFGALVIVQACLDALRSWAMQMFGNLLTFQMVGNLVRHLLRLPSDFFEKRQVGDILSRMGSTQAIQDALTKGIVSALIDGVMAVIAVLILFLYSPLLAGVVVAAVLLNLLVALAFYPIMRARLQEQLVASGVERSHIMETIRAATTIKLMGGEIQREGRWRNLYGRVINATLALGRYQISVGLAQAVVTGVSTVLVIFLGARAIIAGHGFSVGMLLAFLSFRQTFSDRTMSLINQAIQFRLLDLHLDRLGDIVATQLESPGPARPPTPIRGGLVFKGVSFRYGQSDPWLFRNIDFEVVAGEFLAITGASGAGKSTLLKLMLGLRSPTEGQVFLDGQPATPELWRAWRVRIGVVAQDDRLLSGTIADNISFFDPDLEMARVRRAAAQARIDQEIERKPMQYLSLIGDMGSSLSAGQRQRVLLARALYRDPDALFLDEGTANLDDVSEQAIGELVASLPITRVIIANRPELVRRATRVIELRPFTGT